MNPDDELVGTLWAVSWPADSDSGTEAWVEPQEDEVTARNVVKRYGEQGAQLVSCSHTAWVTVTP